MLFCVVESDMMFGRCSYSVIFSNVGLKQVKNSTLTGESVFSVIQIVHLWSKNLEQQR